MTVSEENPDGTAAEPVGAFGPVTAWAPSREWSTAFEPRWGRIVFALVGAVGLCTALITAVLGILGIVSPLVPVLCIVVVAAAVGTLRMLAIRDRYARVDRAFAEAMGPLPAAELQPAVEEPPAPAAPRRPTVLFDAEDTTPRRTSPMALRTAALASAHGSSAVDVRNAAGGPPSAVPPVDADLTGTAPVRPGSWAPVEIPRPTYVESAKAERPAPAPLDLPEAPKASTRTPIKTAEAAARRAGSEECEGISGVPRPRIDLDNVLQRRRA